MGKTKTINVSDGVNPITKTIDLRKFRRKYSVPIVVKTHNKPKHYIPENPDPTEPFIGKDGNWYKIAVRIEYPTNCYLVAMRWITPVKNTLYGIPGFLVGRVPFTIEEFKECIIQDLEVCGRKVHEVIDAEDIPETLPKAERGTYWVKVFFENDNVGTFHIAWKDELSGRWIHKLGWEAPIKVLMRNIEYYCPYDELKSNPMFVGITQSMSKSDFINFCLQMGLHEYVGGVSKSEYEDKDNAPYLSYSPDVDPNGFLVHKPAFVMRIDE